MEGRDSEGSQFVIEGGSTSCECQIWKRFIACYKLGLMYTASGGIREVVGCVIKLNSCCLPMLVGYRVLGWLLYKIIGSTISSSSYVSFPYRDC